MSPSEERGNTDALLGEPVPEIKWRIGGLTKKIEKFQDHQDSGLCQIQGETEKSAICDKAMARLRELAPVGQRVPRAIFSQPSLHLLTLVCIIILGGFHCSQMRARVRA